MALAATVGDAVRVPPEDALRLVRAYADAPGFEVNAAMRAGRFTGLEHIRVPVTLGWPEYDRLVRQPAHLPLNGAQRRPRRLRARPDVGRARQGDQPVAGR